MFYLKKLVAFALPPMGLVLIALVGLWVSRKHPRTGRTIGVIALLCLAVLSFHPVADALTRSLEVHPPISAERLARAQAIVVLGGGTYYAAPEYGVDTVNSWTLERIRYAVRLQRSSELPILVTGGAPYGKRPEAENMKEAIERDFQGQVRWLESASRDTAENAVLAGAILRKARISRVVLVSQGWHLRRAVPLFERQGLEVIAGPTGFVTRSSSVFERALPSAVALAKSSNALREWLGQLVNSLTN